LTVFDFGQGRARQPGLLPSLFQRLFLCFVQAANPLAQIQRLWRGAAAVFTGDAQK
jgi:hypothetical protein